MKEIYNIGIVLLSLAVAACLGGCYDDKGNYDYHELDQLEIDTTGTGTMAEYSIMRFDTLRIAPHVVFQGREATASDPLDYQWTIYSAVSGSGGSTVIDTIGHQAVLDTVIARTGGSYYVQLVVTNRTDGIKQFLRIPVSVSEVFDGGWMVFYESADEPGHSDLALVLNPWTKLNANYNRYYPNLYSATNGERIDGVPVRCLDIAVSLASGNNYVGLCTDKTLVGASENGMEKALSFSDFFYNPPSAEAPVWYGEHGSGVMSGQSSEVLINNENQIYTNTYSFSPEKGRSTKFGVRKLGDGIGRLAPWNAEVPNTLNYGVVVYDQTNGRFLYCGYNEARIETFGEQDNTIAAFDVNNTGMQLVMGDWGRGESRGVGLRPYDYIIMRRGGNHYLAVANFATTTPASTAIGVGLYPMDALCPDIANVTSMSASHVGSFIYYAAGNSVYAFAYDSQQQAQAVWTAPAEDEQVTCVRIMKYYHGTIYGYGFVPQSDNLVHIATWNPNTRRGHLYEYRINPASGILDNSRCYDYDVPGRVGDMAWKFSMQ